MTLVTILSTCAMLLGLGGILPQLVRMVRSRSAGGQAPLGRGLGCAAHASMAYVNFFGFGSLLLSASNLVAGSLCATAILLITTLRDRAPAPAPVAVDDRISSRSGRRCWLERLGRERVAVGRLAARLSALEPRTSLRRRPMREAVGVDAPAGLLLQPVVADRL